MPSPPKSAGLSRPYLAREKLFLEPCMQCDTHHLRFGRETDATPDGRLAGTPFSQNFRPCSGSCTKGLTGMFNAMLHLPSDRLRSGALNLDIDPRQFAGEEGRELFGTMLASYFDRGGLHAQITSVRIEDLIGAQKNPHAHRDLRVRVTGYSGVFVVDTWRFAEANGLAKARGFTPYTIMQQRFSYLHPIAGMAPKYRFNEYANRERLRCLADKNIPMVAYSCLCKGAYEDSSRLQPDLIEGERMALIRRMAAERGVTPSAVVLAWLMNAHRTEGFPRIIPLFSARPAHFAANMRALELTLTDEVLAEMNSKL